MNTRLLWLWIALLGCATPRVAMPRPAPSGALSDEPALRAGIAEVDITPPIGLGLFGHGPEGRIATGTELRLRCHVFVILGSASARVPSQPLALIPCELAAPSLLLQRRIAALVAQANVPIASHQLLLTATHTHAAPGNFYTATNYAGVFSTRMPGFDPRVLEQLASRIARGVIDAYQAAKITRVRVGIWQDAVRAPLTRNRNPQAPLHDRNLPSWLVERVSSQPERAEERAVDPTLTVLRVDRRVETDGAVRYEPYGLLATFGAHPTVLSHASTHYSGDAFGYASRYVAQAIAKPGFVAALANGIEGDVMFARGTTGVREARRFGRRLADEIVARYELLGAQPARMLEQASVRVAYRELVLAGRQTAQGGVLTTTPELGTAAAGGGDDHPTLMRVLPQANPGAHASDSYQVSRPKLPVLAPLGKMRAGVDFPGVAPITIAQLGTHYFVGMPAELTTVAGVRAREAVADELGLPQATPDQPGRGVVMLGLTNEYLLYVATREEYPLQLYEGASTLYGPWSAEFLSEHAACLARWLARGCDADCKLDQARAVNRTYTVRYLEPSDAQLMLERAPDSVALSPAEPIEPSVTRDNLLLLQLAFTGPHPAAVRARDDLWIEVRDANGGLVDDDRGTQVASSYDFARQLWIASFVPDLAHDATLCGKRLRFVIGAGRARLTPPAFEVDCAKLGSLSEVWP
jgi:neutral ceramidase